MIASRPDPTAECLLNEAAVLERFDGDADLMREIVELFLQDRPKRMAAVRGALARHDGDALALAAHSLKGSAGNFGASHVMAAALELEMIGRSGDFAHAEELWARLEEAMAQLTTALECLGQLRAEEPIFAQRPNRYEELSARDISDCSRAEGAMTIVLDKEAALERVEGDIELLRELVQLFLDDAPVRMAEIGAALEERSGDALRVAAHTLKGAASNLSAARVAEAAKCLEEAARAQDFAEAGHIHAVLRTEVERLTAELATLL